MKKTITLLFAMALLSCKNNDEQKTAEMLVKNYLDSTLNDPKSYEPVEFGKFTRLKDTISEFQGEIDTIKYHGVGSITHKYRAKNGFGAYLTKTDVFHIDSAMRKADCCYRK